MTPGFLYKECMHWVSQIQAIRNELKRVNSELSTIQQDKTLLSEKMRFKKEILTLGQSLDAVEGILLSSLNNGTTYWAGHSQTYDTPRIEPCENDLYDRLKYIFNAYIELQRSITGFLSGHPSDCMT